MKEHIAETSRAALDRVSVRRAKSRAISRRLTISLCLTVALASALAILLIYVNMTERAKKDLEARADETRDYLMGTLETPLWNVNNRSIMAIGEAISQNELVVKLDIKGQSGRMIYTMEKEQDSESISRSGKVFYEGDLVGEIDFSLTSQLYEESNRTQLFLYMGITLFILASLFLMTGIFIRKFLRRPLESLNEVVNSYSEGDYDTSVTDMPYSEFRPFGEVLTQMGAKIKAQFGDLQRSEEKYRHLFNSGNDAIFILSGAGMDDSGMFLDVNQVACTRYGYTRDEFLGLGVRSIDKAPHELQEEILKSILEGERAVCEVTHVSKGGLEFPVEMNANLIEFEGSPAVFSVCRDITERKRAEEELRRLRNLLSNIVNSMPSVLVGVDTEGRITQWNQEAERETGVRAGDAQGRTLADVFPRLVGGMEKVRQSIRERKPLKDEKVATRMNGDTRFEDVTVYPLTSNGVEGAVIRIDDVTERVRIEEMMIHSEKMMSVGGLAAGMAHEINNPLSGILQGAQNIERRTSADLAKNTEIAQECGTELGIVRNYLEKRGVFGFLDGIRESAKRASRIIANMLQFSRPGRSEKTLVALPTLMDRTVDLASSDYDLRKKYDFRHIEIVREYDPEIPDVSCSDTEISQVLLNLLKNAAEAMAQGPMDHAPKIVLRARSEGETVRIEVEDNGPGMDGTVCKRVFEPFFSTKGGSSGTGLGLSVSYFIVVENHGGGMSVESSPGHGTKFVIRLPIEQSVA